MARTEVLTYVRLRDGSSARVRRATPPDADRVLGFYDAMSARTRRLRFLATGRRSAEQAAARVAELPDENYRAFVAESGQRVLGVADFARESGGTSADISLAVADDHHHRGLGTALLERLVQEARSVGISEFSADALTANHEVLRVFADLGLPWTQRVDGPDIHCTVELTEVGTYSSAVDRRASVADVASLRPLLTPRSVVVVGAGRRPGSVGRSVLRNLRRTGFPGPLYAVNPHAESIEQVHCHPSVAALPRVPDLAVLAVPAPAVPGVAEGCGDAGVRALLVLTSDLDHAQAAELTAACHTYGMRMVGPNCLGLLNTSPDVRMDATFSARPPLAGTAGVGVQSGGVGIAVLAGMSRLGIGVSSFISLGDKYDVSGNDLLRWWEADGVTDLALLHLESFGNPRAFSRTARRVAHAMPLLTVDSGRSPEGRRAAASHTAAAATRTMTRQALFVQAGITATRSTQELLDAAALMHSQPLPRAERVAVLTDAGGIGVLAADACTEAGLSLPPLSAKVTDAMLAELPRGASAANPVDATAAVSEDRLRRCVDLMSDCDEIDALVVALVPTAVASAVGEDLVQALTHDAGHRPRPVIGVLPSQSERTKLLPVEGGGRVPAYGDAQEAMRALAHAVARTRWLARPVGSPPKPTGIDRHAARGVVSRFLAQHRDGGWLNPATTAELVGHYSVPLAEWAWAESQDDTVRAAERLGGSSGRVALKACWPGLVHKSTQGAVVLDLTGSRQVRSAYGDLIGRFGDRMTGVLVQSMVPRGIELFSGMVQDEVFGPMVLFGSGGTATEILADHAARLAPLTDVDVRDLMLAPRCARLLYDPDGHETVDVAAVSDLLARLSLCACDLPELVEADLNPVVALPDGVVVPDVRVRLRPLRSPGLGPRQS
ncbi:GNAT family N-acetyltransferase [Streptomyces sp. NPDC014623]|uniref:bifunctional acetate--CoA ligase family protein/GNAT family N-acetyltransferase n=1 Tax=Streptomyces sp. NPDC014623 TaxID=3364875 RepID=UPI00370004C4